MDRAFAAGLALTAIGLAGYLGGMAVAYPGRAFSITVLMVGATVLAVSLPGGEAA